MKASRDPDPIVRAATDKLLARERGHSASERAEFERWLASDPRHASVYREVERTWSILGAMPDEPAEDFTPKRSLVRRIATWALPLAAAAAIVVALTWPKAPAADFRQTVATAVGVIRQIELPDGSVIQLNTDSAMDVAYTVDSRVVKLTKGEAHFTVTKSKDRPFIVTAAGIDVRAVGTAFNVHLRSSVVEVLVTEGRVAVADAEGRSLLATTDPDPVLTAGSKAIISLATPTPATPVVATVATVQPPQIAQALSWRDKQLRFVDQSLSDIAADFNRYNTHKLTIADPALGAKKFGGTFPSHDYANLVKVLQAEFGVLAEEKGGETILRLPPPAPVTNR